MGTIEEWFASKLKQGDVFTFAGRTLEFFKIYQMQVLVKNAPNKKGRVVSWMGGRMSFSAQMSELLREELYNYQVSSNKELKSLDHIFTRQKPRIDHSRSR